MSGLLCAHLNFIGPTSTYEPTLSFRPQGPIIGKTHTPVLHVYICSIQFKCTHYMAKVVACITLLSVKFFLAGNLSSSQLRYAASPRESVCTENFTPWTKLLPCGTTAGLASLFSALKLYDSDYHSLGVQFTPVCLVRPPWSQHLDCGYIPVPLPTSTPPSTLLPPLSPLSPPPQDPYCAKVSVQLLQTVTVVFPPAISKQGFIDWSLHSLFSKRLTSSCPVADSSQVVLATGGGPVAVRVEPQPSRIEQRQSDGDVEKKWLIYDVPAVIGTCIYMYVRMCVPRVEKWKIGDVHAS